MKSFPATPEIDLSAPPQINFQIAQFVSWNSHLHAFTVDAFSISWKRLNYHTFPYFSLILSLTYFKISKRFLQQTSSFAQVCEYMRHNHDT